MKNTLLTLKITFIQFILLFSFSAFGQCNIDALSVEITACEGELFDASINFEYENTSDQFVVAGNGNNYGTFNYADLPITLTSLEADCVTEYEFVVTDVNNNDCTDFVEWGIVCCDEECVINSVDYDNAYPDCIDGNMAFEWLVFSENTSEVGFDIFLGDDFLAFVQYDGIGPYSVNIPDTGTEFFTLTVCDNDNPDCCHSSEWPNACYEEPICEIGTINYEISDCENDLFNIILNFEHANTSGQFTVAGNGVSYGTFSYDDLPITIEGLEGNCSTEYEFVVTDIENNNCSNIVEVGTVCCGGAECDLFDLVIEVSTCDGTEFIVTFDFEYTGTTNDFFDWEIPGYDSGFAAFEDLPLSIDINNSNVSVFELIINENDNPDCAIDGLFDNPCFEPNECFIGELNISASECDNNEYSIEINFEYENTSDQFFLKINGDDYGSFNYAELPIVVGGFESNCDGVLNIEVFDSQFNGTCFSGIDFETICCGEECDLFDLVIETSDCDGGFFEVTFDFEYTGTTNDFFFWEIAGYGSGTAAFEDLPLTLTIQNTNTSLFDLYISEDDNPNCFVAEAFDNPCFSGECFIGELNVDVSECDGNMFFVVINFEYENTSDQFTVNGNGNSYGTFSYADLPITIDGLESDCNLIYEFVVHDVNNNDCASDIDIGEVCCEGDCEMTALDFGPNPECVDGLIVTEWFIAGNNVSEVGYDIFINNVFETFVQYNESNWYDFDIEDPGTEYITIKACDNDNADCCITIEFMNPCFDPAECDLYDLVIETSDCDGGLFEVTFDFEYTGTTNNFFDWEIPGYSSGFAEFSDLPLTIIVQNTNVNGFDLFINENDNPDCAIEGSFENPCFDPEECFIGELNIDVSDCEDDLFFVTIDFEYDNTSDEFFVNSNGTNYGPFMYADLPVIIEGLESNCDVPYEFLVYDSQFNGTCESDANIGIVCCDNNNCFIGELDVEVSECDGNFYFVTINFEYENTSNQFTVAGNGNNYGTYSYADLPITIDGLESNCDLEVEFVVNDVEFNDCASDVGIGVICCDDEDCFIGELDVEVSECDGNFYFVTIDFEYENTSDQFTVAGNGNNYGTYSYADLPITIDGLESNCDLEVEFVVNDVEFNDCASDVGIGVVCCDDEGCFIGELDVEISECDGNFFFVVINFEYENTSNQFTVAGNGNNYGTYSYSDLPITIDGLESDCDLEYEFVVYDAVIDDCASDIEIGEICCDEEQCEIVSIDFGDNPICEEGYIVTEWLILGENISEVGFDIFINNDFYIFVEYNETNWYDFDIENPGTEYFTIMACDNDNEDCCYTWEVMNPCFEGEECDLFDLDFDVSECDGDYFILEVDFEYTGNTNESFVWEIPGIGSGTDLFSNLPLVIEIENSTESQFTFFANEVENPDCSIVGTFGNPCYDSDECVIDGVTAVVVVCEDDLFDVEIDFEYDNVGSTFSIVGNGVEYGTFEYSDLPVVLTGLAADCNLEYEFVVMDNENEECSDFVEIGTICCEDFNQINGLNSITIIEGEIFNVTFDITNTTLKGCKIEVYVDGDLYETLSDEESSFTVGPFDCGQEGVIEITLINTCSDAEWTLMFDLANIDCTTGVEINIDVNDLKWNMMQKTLTLEGENPVSVNVQLMNAQGALILAENGVEIGWSRDFSNYPRGLYFVRVVDNKSNSGQGFIKKILIH